MLQNDLILAFIIHEVSKDLQNIYRHKKANAQKQRSIFFFFYFCPNAI
jgi:hypothetical protein